ncbi:hypothetical protein BU17DRAFT_62062 [Hysterangium stoloniferum]|nr:hypothetical protein BU17DRAFT_62062 [Hysterangium stoloniferum]
MIEPEVWMKMKMKETHSWETQMRGGEASSPTLRVLYDILGASGTCPKIRLASADGAGCWGWASENSYAVSQASVDTSASHQFRTPLRPNSVGHSPLNPISISPADAVNHLSKIFSPLIFPEDVAQRMTTHVSWERGVQGHNARLGFVGRRVLHTYLLLFLHECSLPPPSFTPPKNAPIPPSAHLRNSALNAGGSTPLTQPYEDISEKLLNTYVLGEHVGAVWELERVMRWTPAIAEMDTLKAERPDTILRSSGLYKVRGATVEGIMGGIFHQFGGFVAHRVFHTRVLPHIYQFGLPTSLHEKMREACDRLGGENAILSTPETRSENSSKLVETPPAPEEKQSRPRKSSRLSDDGYIKVDPEDRIVERRRMGSVG